MLLALGLALGFLLGSARPLEAGPEESRLPAPGERVIHALRIDHEIVLDGRLDEPGWQLAEPAGDFIQRLPIYGAPATERTEVRLLYDDDNLYVGVYCFDSAGPDGIVVNDITKDFYTLDSDGFQVVIDTYHDKRNSFLFGTNPMGGRFDMQIGADGDAGNTDWDGIWHVATQITENGWQLEMAIPFKTLRFRDLEEQVWGVNFERRVRRKSEDTYWSPLPPQFRLGRVSLAGTLKGIEGIKQGRNLYVKPFVTGSILRKRSGDTDFSPEVGVDVKYGVSSQLTMDFTLNTDFSQVEADEEQINLTRFSLFFPEKRDFFLENAGIFAWGGRRRRSVEGGTARPDLMPFFSRRIGISADGSLVPIHGGARLTGRSGHYTLGLLSMQTGEFDETPGSNFSVVRVRRDILRQSDFGGIFVNKQESGSGFNRTYGMDANLTFFRHLDVNSYLLRTESPDLESRDAAGTIQASWRDRLFDLRAGHLHIGENFNPEVGFAPRTGIRKSMGEFALTPRPEERIPWVREFRPSVEVDYITGPNGSLETRRLETRFSVILQNSATLSVGRESNFERLPIPFRIRPDLTIPVGDYDFAEYFAFYQGDRSRTFSGMARVSTGDFFDGTRNNYALGVNFHPNFRFGARMSWSRNDVELPGGDFTTNLLTTRLNYSFSTRVFLHALIQYNSDDGEVSSNVRFNFMPRPLSDLYLVYNERRTSTGDLSERALIAKFNYIFSY